MRNLRILFVLLVIQAVPSQLQGINILINHIGYETRGSKQAVIQGQAGNRVASFKIIRLADGKEVFAGSAKEMGPVDKWRTWHFWTIDFDDLKEEGFYCIECFTHRGVIRSFPFRIQDNILERHTLSNVIAYFKAQRCSGLLDRADSNMTFTGPREGERVDVHGGWYDATGDYGKHLSHLSFSTYFNPQQLCFAVFSLFKTYEALEQREDANFNQFKRRMLDEAMYGADYLFRIKTPQGSFYRTVSGRGPKKAPEDRRITPAMRGFRIKTTQTKDQFIDDSLKGQEGGVVYEVGYRSGGGVAIAALAMAGRYSISGDFTNRDYLQAAVDAFFYLEQHNLELTNDGRENIVDDYCALMAATELYKATRNSGFKTAADRRAKNLTGRLATWNRYKDYFRADDQDRPFFHASDAGLPIVSLLYYLEIADEAAAGEVLNTIERNLRFELAVTSEVANPFGYSRQLIQNIEGQRRTSFFFPHDTEASPWWQGENARLGSMAAAARMGAAVLEERAPELAEKLRRFAQNQLNWILGLNPFDACMLHGSGRNNPEYMFFGSYQYTNFPGGICNGITAGLDDENSIDFNLPFEVTGEDHDWRWGEQWLPHASWYTLAVALGER